MTTTASKRTLDEANIDSSNPSKKRKLNEEESISTTTNNNINKSNDDDKKNDNTAKSNDENNDKNGKNDKDDKNDKEDPNSDVSNWTFKASAFTFGDNSWVKQTSNASDLSNDESAANDNNKIPSQVINDNNTTDSFAKFEGLGFKKVLDDENSKGKEATNGKSEDTDNDKHKSNDKDNDNKESDKDKKKDDGWGGAWSNSNPDGTFS